MKRMKITYKLYSNETPEGQKLAELSDMSQANVMEPYYRQTYNRDQFKVTVKYGRQKEEWLTGSFR
jgi:hypothetical protein